MNLSDYTGYAPGADDNASAVAIALEMIRILAPAVKKTPPATSIIIAAVAGEEQGLYGSNFLAQTCEFTLKDFPEEISGLTSHRSKECIS